MEVIVQDPNSITIQVDQGRSGRGITDIEPVTIGSDLYLQFTFTDGTTENVGPIAEAVSQTLYATVRNVEATTILKGQPVYLFGAQGDTATVKLAFNTSDATSAKTLGIAAENIPTGSTGLVMCQGVQDGVDTSSYTPGDTLYLGATAGTLTNVKPQAPNHLVYIGVVERSNAGNGQIYVRIQNGYELDEIHDVQIISPVNGQTIVYDSATSLWKNQTLPTAGGGTGLTSFTANRVFYSSSTSAIGSSANLTFDGTTLTANALTTTSTVTINAGTANGVTYLNGSKVLTSGSALTFTGTRFGIGETSPVAALTVKSGNGDQASFNNAGERFTQLTLLNNGTSKGGLWVDNTNSLFELYGYSGMSLTFSANGSEGMRLTSTGLGIGTSSPNYRLQVQSAGTGTTAASNIVGRFQTNGSGYDVFVQLSDNVANSGGIGMVGGAMYLANGTTRNLTLDSSGNLGLGLVPSAWGSAYKATQLTYGSLYSAAFTVLGLSVGAYNDNTNWRYVQSGQLVGRYEQSAGQHQWFTAAAGTAGNAISFTQAMTLTAGGNLGVGETAPDGRLDVAKAITFTNIDTYPQLVIKATTGSTGDRLNLAVDDTNNLAFIQAVNRGTGAIPLVLQRYDGDVGIGTATPAAKLDVVGGGDGGLQYRTGTRAVGIGQVSSEAALYWGSSTALTFFSGTERARITSGGDLLVGTTSGAFTGRVVTLQPTSASDVLTAWNSATSGDNSLIGFFTDGGTGRGSITYNRAGGLVAYNTTSDYRAKDILGPVVNPGATIDALKVYEGQMKGATQARPMLVAHEAQAVAPYSVTGEKDAVNDDGTPKFQQMDVSSLVPLLIAEIQSLRARVAALEA